MASTTTPLSDPVYDLNNLSQVKVDQVKSIVRSAVSSYLTSAYGATRYDLRRGVLHDLVVQLNALLITAVEAEMDLLRKYGSLQAVTDDPSLASDAVVDRILANYRVTRSPAAAASGPVTILLSAAVPVVVPQGAVFSADVSGSGPLEFATVSAFTARTSSGDVVSSTDRLLTAKGANWAFDVDVVCRTTGSGGNLPAGTALAMSSPVSRYVSSYTSSGLLGGADAESNQALIGRLAAGASTRSWGTRTSLLGLLQAEFSTLRHASAVGAGDACMLRDRHGLVPVSGGGRVDVYARTSALYQSEVHTLQAVLYSKVGAVGTWQLSLPRETAPGFYEVQKVLLPSQALTATGFAPSYDARGFDLTDSEADLGGPAPDVVSALEAAYSPYQTAVVRFADTTTDATGLSLGATANYQVVFRVMPDLADVQTFLNGSDRRPLSSDVLVKAPVPVFCTASFDLVLASSLPAPDLAAVRYAVSAAVHEQGFSDRLSASTLASAARGVSPESTIDDVALTGRLRKPNGTDVALSGTQTMTLTPDTDNMTSADTAVFFLPPDAVTVTLVRV